MPLHSLHHENVDTFLQMLRKWLVNPLPKGSALTAIFDSCNSGTLLGNVSAHTLSGVAYTQKDLEHYECNDVYRPWVNKGKRKSKTLQNNVGTSASRARHCLSPYPFVQLGRMAKTLVLCPRADPALRFGRLAARRMPAFAVLSKL